MPPPYRTTRRVEFVDTDMAGIVHFANFYKYMEETEHGFFRSLGLKIVQLQPDGAVIGWPRVRSTCSFDAPAYYDDLLEIDLDVKRLGVKSLTMSYTFRQGDTQIATGEMKTVCCIHEAEGKFHSIEIPPHYRAKFGEGTE
jgi:YbgC/YbaW family acyl-CoA thioester hydrolase